MMLMDLDKVLILRIIIDLRDIVVKKTAGVIAVILQIHLMI